MTDRNHLLEIIKNCTDKVKLKNWIINGERIGADDIVEAATRQLIRLEASMTISESGHQSEDALALEFWKSIIALELALTKERGKTIRLARTRQKVSGVGIEKTLTDLMLKPTPSEGYYLMRDRGMLDLSLEAVVLRFEDRFSQSSVEAARGRLAEDTSGQ